jgi:hypothetical protein
MFLEKKLSSSDFIWKSYEFISSEAIFKTFGLVNCP